MSIHARTSLMPICMAILAMCLAQPTVAQANAPPEWATQLAQRIETAVQDNDWETIESLSDDGAVVAIVIKDLPGTPEFRKGVEERIEHALSETLVRTMDDADHYKLRAVRTRDGRPSALFRFISEDAGFTYHELLFGESVEGEHRVIDMYLASTGELYSDMLKRVIRLSSGQGAANLEKIVALNAASRAGRHEDALKVFNTLPDDVRREKTFQIIRISSALKANDEDALLEAGEEFRRLFPGDPAADIIMFDYYYTRKELKEGQAALQRLLEYAGEDAYLTFLEGRLYEAENRDKEARAAYERAAAMEPTLESPHWGLLQLALNEQNHRETVERIRLLESLGVEFDVENMKEDEAYGPFVRSTEFTLWERSRDDARETSN